MSIKIDGDYYTQSNKGSILWVDEEGKKHRVDGPAVIQKDGVKEWWVDGKVLDIFEACTAESIITDMPMVEVLMFVGNPIFGPYVKYRIEKESD